MLSRVITTMTAIVTIMVQVTGGVEKNGIPAPEILGVPARKREGYPVEDITASYEI